MKNASYVLGLCLMVSLVIAVEGVFASGGCCDGKKEPEIKRWTEQKDGKTIKYMTIDGIMVHETDEKKQPQPEVIKPGLPSRGDKVGTAPEKAIVLFDGTKESMENWEGTDGKATKWKFVDGALESVKKAGMIQTKQKFGSCQLHVEWASPKEVKGNGQGRGNSGVFLQGTYEVQVLDCFENKTYPDGQAGALYGRKKPDVNVCRGPGEWQTYDIIYHRPIFKDGKVVRKATFTVLHNGVLIHDHVELTGATGWDGPHSISPYREHADKLPIKLQDHGNPVRFRNIWVRPIED